MYFKPYIDETGIHIPLYIEIRDSLIQEAQRIFGEDAYLEPDSQDYQMISAFSEKVNDVNELLVQAYNNRAPQTAVGSALDGVVKLNGIRRKGSTHSLCPLVLKGTPNTRIYSGLAGDTNGGQWSFGDVTIPQSGTIEVMATNIKSGPVYAKAGTIAKIVTQTLGWLSVENKVDATAGRNIESNPALRARQAISTANPSKTVLQGMVGGVAALLNVTRYRIYENDSGEPDENGIPAHSTSLVAEGGNETDIAQIIHQRKTPGSGTYGDVEIEVGSPETTLGPAPPIRFFRPRYVDVMVRLWVKPLSGYVTQTVVDIRQNICNYLNSLRIGESLTVSALYVPAMAATVNIAAPCFSIQRLLIGQDESSLSAEDMKIAFNAVTRGVPDLIQIVTT